MLSTQIAITIIYTCNMFVLFCACDVMNVLSVKKKKCKFTKKLIKKKKKNVETEYISNLAIFQKETSFADINST